MNEKITDSEKNEQQKSNSIREYHPRNGFFLSYFSIDDAIIFEFSYKDNTDHMLFKFECSDTTAIVTSNPFQRINSNFESGILDSLVIPDNCPNAVLKTVSPVNSTWATQTHHVKLTLSFGEDLVWSWQWEATFEVPMLPFNLNGTWSRL